MFGKYSKYYIGSFAKKHSNNAKKTDFLSMLNYKYLKYRNFYTNKTMIKRKYIALCDCPSCYLFLKSSLEKLHFFGI